MSISDDLALLTPGSVFVNKKGRVAKLLFVTNTSLLTTAPEHIQAEHPVQIVYANEDGEVFNRDLDDFIAKYKFYNVDPELEARLDNLLVFSEDDPALEVAAEQDLTVSKHSVVDDVQVNDPMWAPTQTNKIVADALTVGDDEEEDGLSLLPPQHEEDNSIKIATPAANLRVVFNTLSGSLVGSGVPAKLSQSLVAYGQEPDITQSLIIHRLTFALDNSLTMEVLQDLFRPREDENDPRHTIDVFDVQTAYSSDSIVWTSYIGVFPDYNKGGLYATVMVGTDEVRAEPTAEAQTQTFDTLYGGEYQQDGTPIVATMDVSQLQQHGHQIRLSEEGLQGVSIQTNPDGLISQNQDQRQMVSLELPEGMTQEQLAAFIQDFQSRTMVDGSSSGGEDYQAQPEDYQSRPLTQLTVGNADYKPTPEDLAKIAEQFQTQQLEQNSTQQNPHTQGIHIHPSIDQLFNQLPGDVPGAL